MWLQPSGSCLRPCIWTISRPPDILLQGIRQTQIMIRQINESTDRSCLFWLCLKCISKVQSHSHLRIYFCHLSNIMSYFYTHMDGLFEIYSWWLWEFSFGSDYSQNWGPWKYMYTAVYIGKNINLHHRKTLQDCNILAEQKTVYI